MNVGKLKSVIDNYGLAMIRLSNIDNNNMAIVNDTDEKHPIRVNIPKYWQIDEALKNELKTANLD